MQPTWLLLRQSRFAFLGSIYGRHTRLVLFGGVVQGGEAAWNAEAAGFRGADNKLQVFSGIGRQGLLKP